MGSAFFCRISTEILSSPINVKKRINELKENVDVRIGGVAQNVFLGFFVFVAPRLLACGFVVGCLNTNQLANRVKRTCDDVIEVLPAYSMTKKVIAFVTISYFLLWALPAPLVGISLYTSIQLGASIQRYCSSARAQHRNSDSLPVSERLFTPWNQLLNQINEKVNFSALKIVCLSALSLPLFYRHSNVFAFGFVVGGIFRNLSREARENLNGYCLSLKNCSILKKVALLVGLKYFARPIVENALVPATLYTSGLLGLELFEYFCRRDVPAII